MVVSDDAGQCDRARRILALRHPRIAFIHCFAHDNNLVKSVLNTSFRTLTKQASLTTVTLNASSSKWLVRAQALVSSTYGKSLGFINLCETRWNSMQGCFASLLRVENDLCQFTAKYEDNQDFPQPLLVFKDDSFWEKLKSAEAVIRPLSNASYKLQRDENTLADVLISYRDIYRGFLGNLIDLELVSLVERRWQKCEQPLILLALFLHPHHVQVAAAMHEEAPQLRLLERLCGYGISYYRRLVAEDDEHDIESLLADFHAWYRGVFVDPSLVRYNGDVGQFWSFAGDVKRGSKLPKLAAVILSIAVNTATCERYFSELAAIHTAKRNRMKPEKARKFSLVRQAVRQLDRAESEEKEPMGLKRIVDATERERIDNCGTAPSEGVEVMHLVEHQEPTTGDTAPSISIEETEEIHLIEHQETPGGDTTEYWQNIFDVLDDNTSVWEGDHFNDVCEFPVAGGDDQIVFNGFDEPIPAPDTTKFPRTNVRTFPQENRLLGIRGQKFSIQTLFSSEKTFRLTPYTSRNQQ